MDRQITSCTDTKVIDSSTTTTGRDYRYPADGGVITLADRRRARVATDGAIAAARLLEADRVFRLAGSDDSALQIVIDHAAPAVVPVGKRGSFEGLRALACGTADGAAIHLRHHSGTCNAPFAHACSGTADRTFSICGAEKQGLLVAAGDPRGTNSIVALATLRVAKREVGAGTRVLLDQLLIATGIAPDGVKAPHSALTSRSPWPWPPASQTWGWACAPAANDLNLASYP